MVLDARGSTGTRTRLRAALRLLTVAALLAPSACGSPAVQGDSETFGSSSPAPTTAEPRASQKVPTPPPPSKWIIDRVTSDGRSIRIPDGAGPFLVFDVAPGSLTGWTGCNNVTARTGYHDGDVFFQDVVTTKRACSSGLAELEMAILKVLGPIAWQEINGDEMTLTLRWAGEGVEVGDHSLHGHLDR